MKFPNIGFFLYICAVILIITLMGLTNHQILAFSKAVNSSLLIGDIVFVHHLKVGENLVADKVFRNGLLGNYKTNGELSSVEVNP